MRSTRVLPTMAALLAFAACGGADEAPAPEAQAPADAALTAAEITAAVEGLDCFLNNATMEEATARPSPLHQEPIVLGRDVGKLCYGAPARRDRQVMGGLVPFGELWRTGANEATALHLPFAVEVGGVALEPGSYSLFTRPGESEWTVYLSPMVERWGIPITDEVQQSVVGSFTVAPQMADDMVEVMEFSWEAAGPDSGTLTLAWENTRVPMQVRKPAAM